MLIYVADHDVSMNSYGDTLHASKDTTRKQDFSQKIERLARYYDLSSVLFASKLTYSAPPLQTSGPYHK